MAGAARAASQPGVDKRRRASYRSRWPYRPSKEASCRAHDRRPRPPASPRAQPRPAHHGTVARAACRGCEIPLPPLEILSAEQVERILPAAYRVLEEAGLEIRSAAAREVYRRAGALVDEDTQLVRIGRDIVEAQLAHAPERFVLHARNARARTCTSAATSSTSARSAARRNISDLEGGRRYGDLEAFRNILKLTHTLGVAALAGRHRGRAGRRAGADPPSVDLPGAHRMRRHRLGGARRRRRAGRGCDRDVGDRARLQRRGSGERGRR